MSIYVNTNVQSVFAQRALGGNTFDLQKSIEKLSTGYRINRASDDAAGLSISEKLTSQIRGLEKAEQNIGDGISLVQTAEGALGVVQDNLQRIRELTVQAANGTNSENELAAIQREVNARVTTIGDIAANTEFNSKTLLTGAAASATTFGNTTLQTGSDQGQTTAINFTLMNSSINTTAVGSIGENAINLNAISAGSTTVNNQAGAAAGARTSLDDIDDMINNVSRMRSELGASQNSLESKADYINIAKENAMSSRSRIKDVDVAKESSQMIKSQILQQTSAAMLSQANQTPQLALNLLP
jgi:flagellin